MAATAFPPGGYSFSTCCAHLDQGAGIAICAVISIARPGTARGRCERCASLGGCGIGAGHCGGAIAFASPVLPESGSGNESDRLRNQQPLVASPIVPTPRRSVAMAP